MNKTRNTNSHQGGSNKDNRSFFGMLKSTLAGRGIMDFDVFFRFSNTYHEKLPIIYANIRV